MEKKQMMIVADQISPTFSGERNEIKYMYWHEGPGFRGHVFVYLYDYDVICLQPSKM